MRTLISRLRLATFFRRDSFSAIRRYSCLSALSTILEQSLVGCCRNSSADFGTPTDVCGKCPDKADDAATGLESVAGRSVSRSPLDEQ